MAQMDFSRGHISDSYIEEYLRIGQLTKEDSVLDVGPSSSSNTLPFAIAHKAGQLLRVDTRKEMIQSLEKKARQVTPACQIDFQIWSEEKDSSHYDVCFKKGGTRK